VSLTLHPIYISVVRRNIHLLYSHIRNSWDPVITGFLNVSCSMVFATTKGITCRTGMQVVVEILCSCGVTLTTTIYWALYRMDRCSWNSKCAIYMMCNFMTTEPTLIVSWKFIIQQLSSISRAKKKILILLKMITSLEQL